MLTIANVRRNAAELLASGTGVTYARLAKRLACSYKKVQQFVNGTNLRNELSINADRRFPGLVFMQAADMLRQRDEFVTRRTLAKECGRLPGSISMALNRHPEWEQIIGVLSESTVRQKMRAKVYEILAKERKTRSVSQFARECNVSRELVYRDLKTSPSLRGVLYSNR